MPIQLVFLIIGVYYLKRYYLADGSLLKEELVWEGHQYKTTENFHGIKKMLFSSFYKTKTISEVKYASFISGEASKE